MGINVGVILLFDIFYLPLLIIMFYDLRSAGYKAIVNPIFWASLLFLLYFALPSLFVWDIAKYFSWPVTNESVLYSQVICAIYSLALTMVYFISPSNRLLHLKVNTAVNDKNKTILHVLWLFSVLYLVSVFWQVYVSGGLVDAFHYDAKTKDPYKIKNLAYIIVPIVVYLFSIEKRYIYFLPCILLIALDIIEGSRTTALIAFAPILISVCIWKRRLFVVPALFFMLSMMVIGIIRSDNVTQHVPTYLNAIGEFRETYITLPLFINNENYVGAGNAGVITSALVVGIAQPLRSEIVDSYDFAGRFISDDIKRGYGLGSNIIIESIYYGYAFLPITLCFFILLMKGMYSIFRRLNIQDSIVLASYLIVFTRLIIREGLYINFGLLVFVVVVYWLPIVIVTMKKFKVGRSVKELV